MSQCFFFFRIPLRVDEEILSWKYIIKYFFNFIVDGYVWLLFLLSSIILHNCTVSPQTYSSTFSTFLLFFIYSVTGRSEYGWKETVGCTGRVSVTHYPVSDDYIFLNRSSLRLFCVKFINIYICLLCWRLMFWWHSYLFLDQTHRHIAIDATSGDDFIVKVFTVELKMWRKCQPVEKLSG